MAMKSIFAAAVLALGLAAPVGAATLGGASIEISGPSIFSFSPATFVVGPGVETTAEHFISTPDNRSAYEFDFTESGLLTVNFSTVVRRLKFGGFSPIVFTDYLGTIGDFTGFTLISSSNPHVTQSDLTFSDDTLSFD